MGKMSRTKGHSYERHIAIRFRERGIPAKRGLGQARNAGEVPDVDVVALWPECKRHRRTNIKAALEQAIEASGESGRIPVAICKDDRGIDTATVRLDDFIELLLRAGWVDASGMKHSPSGGVAP